MDDPLTDIAEFPDDAAYAWWRTTNPAAYILAVRARKPPMLHRARCREVDRDEHPGRLHAAGSRQVCALTAAALRAWARRELPETTGLLARCPKCGA